ncbi:heme exporter protein CcmD [Limibaculum sp. M0105]|uniref:Heme exporter protein D n=1 Tax=Thermohalobaculum xanthum TaxID=2753746 RepID=A0A8J7SBP6_9RHOB|nr:heme exporter protein CcmD [Thermohalobaculum xanthum]MBK0399077.1 heme exporter protein CcmD [Thermohalobaculum xanthum]
MIDYLANDRHALYVVSAYGATAAILAWLVWSTLAANARARRDMQDAEQRRRKG